MKQYINKLFLFIFTIVVFVTPFCNAQITATQMGMYDFKVMQNLTAAEMDGSTDVTTKLQNAVNASRDARQTLFIPSGTYKISAQIACIMTHEAGSHSNSPNMAVNIVGSAINHPTIVLADNTPAFSGASPKAIFHYKADPSLPNPFNDNKPYDSSWIMEGGIRGIDIDLGNGNAQAVGIFWSSAQHCYLEDININARDGFAGLTGIGGANVLLANTTVTGGTHGLYLPEFNEGITFGMENAPQNTITGCTFTGQADAPISIWGWGGITIVGTKIVTNSEIAIDLRCDNTVYVFPFSLIDSSIEFTNPQTSNSAIKNQDQGTVTLRGVYTLGAGKISDNNDDENLLPAGELSEWTRTKRYNYVAKAEKTTYGGPSYLTNHYDAMTGVQSNIAISEQEVVATPPINLTSQHIWSTTPSFEDADAFLVTTADEIQPAIDAGKKVCLAKGVYSLSSPITLKSNTILFGCPGIGTAGAILEYGWVPSAQTWLINTENSAAATTYLMDITTDSENADHLGSLHWQAGKNSIIRNVWFDKSWDEHEKDLVRFYFSGNGGGRVFNYQDEKGGNPSSSAYRKVKISGTSQQLTFYGLNLERGGNQYEESTFPMLEIEAASNIRIFGAKTETSQPYASIHNGVNIFMTNVIDFAHFGAVAKNYIEITGTSSNKIEITNSMFLKSPDASYLIVADPWNTNEVPRTMTLGCYHRNWSSISGESTSPLGIADKETSIFSVFPNPTSESLTIKLIDTKKSTVVQIRNINGQLIKEVVLSSSNQNISIENLPSGLYFINPKNDQSVSAKFIKQ